MQTGQSQPSPILERNEILDFIAAERSNGATIVLANGCFDVIHVGHIRYLSGAKAEGDLLIVGINSDEVVRKLKGSGRPLQSAKERAELIASLRVVDAVTIFEEPTVDVLIGIIRPDVHAKGTDYTVDSVPERETVLKYGGRVAIVGDEKSHSSSEIISLAGRPT